MKVTVTFEFDHEDGSPDMEARKVTAYREAWNAVQELDEELRRWLKHGMPDGATPKSLAELIRREHLSDPLSIIQE